MEAISTTTYTDVVTKFKYLNKKYYIDRGCLILTIDHDFAKQFLGKHPNLVWSEKYNVYAETYVLSTKVNILIFGKPFMVYLHRPIKQVHRYEYEDFFGFGGHCQGFSLNRIILTFEESFNKEIDIEYLLMTGTLAGSEEVDTCECCTIDEKYIKNALKMLLVGGYVKRWAAFNEFKEWFKERGFNFDLNIDNAQAITSFIFEDYHVVE